MIQPTVSNPVSSDDSPPRAAIHLFLEGARAPWEGLRFPLKHSALWPDLILPLTINLVVTVSLLCVAIAGCVRAILWIHGWPYFATATWGRAQEGGVVLVVVLAAVGLFLAVNLLVSGTVTAIFNERLARKVELLLGTPASDLHDTPFVRQVVEAMADFAMVALTAVSCLLLGCVPLVGFLIGGGVNFYVAARVFGGTYINIPMALRGIPGADRKAFVRRHRAAVLGLGGAVLCVTLIPIVGSLLLTTSAAGAVLLYRRLRESSSERVATR